MTTPSTREQLYAWLPKLYKLRDADQGEPLRTLLSIIQAQLDRVQGDIGDLYDNWFIETCAEWVVPYIGDLLGVRGQYAFDEATVSLRPFVANTLGYRRRKGTVTVLEQLAQDTTGWPGRAVEFFRLLATTQNLNHVRSVDLRTPDLRDTAALELLGGPFESAMHFAEVRRIDARDRGLAAAPGAAGPGRFPVWRGRYNLPNVGIFLWRLIAFALDRAPAIPVPGDGPGRYTFSQLGRDAPLFNPSRTDLEADRIVEADVPGPLRARALFDESEAGRRALDDGKSPEWTYFAPARPSLRVFDDAGEIAPELIQVCDLSKWTTLPPAKTVTAVDPPNPPVVKTTRVAVDPVLGRVAVVSGKPPDVLRVSYSYGFSAPIGGGSYSRPNPGPDPSVEAYLVAAADPSKLVDGALATAIAAWIADGNPDAVISIGDNALYEVPDVSVPAGKKLTIRALDGFRPVLRPKAPWKLELSDNARLALSGVVVAGAVLEVNTKQSPKTAADHHLAIVDCTLVPGLSLDGDGNPVSPDASSLQVAASAAGPLALTVDHSIVGRLDLRNSPTTLAISDSIVDGCGGNDPAIWKAGDAKIERATILGAMTARSVEASNVIFGGAAVAERTQIGCVRFSFVSGGSELPRRFKCQPDLAVSKVAAAYRPLVLERMKPSYTSRRYGDPGYAQLDATCPDEIKTGADDGAEMGAFQLLHQPQRLSNLVSALEEYLRFGLEAGMFLVT